MKHQYDCCWPSDFATRVCGSSRLCNTTRMAYSAGKGCTCKDGRSGPGCTVLPCEPGYTHNATQGKSVEVLALSVHYIQKAASICVYCQDHIGTWPSDWPCHDIRRLVSNSAAPRWFQIRSHVIHTCQLGTATASRESIIDRSPAWRATCKLLLRHMFSPSLPCLAGALQVDAGELTTCVLRVNGTVECWGGDEAGSTLVPSGLSNVKAIVNGGHLACAQVGCGDFVCWGAVSTRTSFAPNAITSRCW